MVLALQEQRAYRSLVPMRYVSRPSLEELVSLKQDYMDFHQRRIGLNRQEEIYFKLKYDVPSPDGKSPLYSPAGYQIVEELINHLAAENPIINVLRRNPDESEIQRAEKLTSWINGYWQSSDITLLLRKMLFHDAVRGCHVLRILYDPGAWPREPTPPIKPLEPLNLETASDQVLSDYMQDLIDYQEDRISYRERYDAWKSYTEEHNPILTQVIDPMFCFWEPGSDPKRIFIVWDRPVDEIIREHPELDEELGNLKAGTKLQWNAYYDEYDYAYWIEAYGSRVLGTSGYGFQPPRRTSKITVQPPTPHHYGFFPFIVDGPWVTPLPEPENQYPSIYYAIKSMLQYESTLLTQIAHMIRINGWAPLIIKSDRAEGQKPIITMQPGDANYIEIEEDVRYLEFSGQTMNVLNTLIQSVNEYTSKGSGLGDLLRGAPKGKSGYQQAQLAAMARVALVPLEHSTERTLRTASRYIFKLVRTQDEKITILGQYGDQTSEATLTPKDVSKIGLIEIKLRTVMPIDEGAKIANLSNMQKLGWISASTAARMAGVQNPAEEHARWIAEDIAQLPEVKKAQAFQFVAEHWPDLFQIMLQLEQQAQAQDQKKNVQVGPGGPGGAGGGSKPGQPGPQAQNAPGSSGELNQSVRQSEQGGMPPKRLRANPQGPGDG